ncbi:UDP-glucuronosyltransferase 3A2 [Monoraphidium neglectum]|uniref:Glycosyltransferase n=1 Tax=Monoraphidium neglectum TaxID=145388 RepID=A0A0D2NF61_9CHLO|nr:UDP-glucuronosyltransferase 3A2 [Monoraphidium neglectum]KIZ03771.1 UDP-glucuronosyltransferase 3A2 [Monoraphidium neglectum]|eukprot:XP_013902790.1 UDP-glucuronosyltransferase 3A2 [Monoraphidium neglectum]
MDATAAANLLFVSVPHLGHISPAIAVARACNERRCAAAGNAPHGPAAGAAGAVRFAALSESRAKVEAAGLEFVDLGPLSAEDEAQKQQIHAQGARSKGKARVKLGCQLFTLMERAMFPPLVEALGSGGAAAGTDAIVADFATLAAHDAAEHLGLPLVLLHQGPLGMILSGAGYNSANMYSHVPLEIPGPFLQAGPLTPAQRAVNPLLKRLAHSQSCGIMDPYRAATRARLGLPRVRLAKFGCSPSVERVLHLVSGSMDLEVERPLPPSWHMTGQHNVDFSEGSFPVPLVKAGDDTNRDLEAFLQAAADAGRPVVYIATGTVAKPSQAQIDAIVGTVQAVEGASFVWSLAKDCHALLPSGDVAEWSGGRAKVLSWAPQQALLGHASVQLFVTHGGLNSTYEGVTAGLPLVVLPYFADQPINAMHVVNKGLGTMLDPWTLTAAGLSRAVRQLLADKDTHARTAEMGRRLRARTPGARRAAELIEEFSVHAACKRP